ncbi:MAG: DUF58 domain-containing protein [Pseudomonadota bacterium]
MLGALTQSFRRRVQAWAHRRQGDDPDPVSLHRGRIYILPTRQGLVFIAMLLVMLVGSMNYNNSLGLALTFLLGSLLLISMHQCHRNLSNLVVRFAGAQPVFAGQTARFSLRVCNESAATRYGLKLAIDGSISRAVDVAPREDEVLEVVLPAEQRGALRLDRVGISTTYPFGLFRVWAWLHMPLSTVVYPRPATGGMPPPPVETDTGGARDSRSGDSDFAGLRAFRPGDKPRHVAWKAYARDEELKVKHYAGTDVATHWFDWHTVDLSDPEQRLSQLTRWVIDAQRRGDAYGLRLPGETIDPDLGASHRRRCLTALALF